MSAHTHHEDHITPYGDYVKVWIALLFLTAMTVGVSYLEMRHFAMFTALLIATVKVSLVVLYFMHVKYDLTLFKLMIAIAVVEYIIFVLLTFSDYIYRV